VNVDTDALLPATENRGKTPEWKKVVNPEIK